MTTKLTLTIEKSAIEKGKRYAKGTQRSLSEMVEKFLESLDDELPQDEMTPIISRLAGCMPLPKDFDEIQALDDYYKEKYGL